METVNGQHRDLHHRERHLGRHLLSAALSIEVYIGDWRYAVNWLDVFEEAFELTLQRKNSFVARIPMSPLLRLSASDNFGNEYFSTSGRRQGSDAVFLFPRLRSRRRRRVRFQISLLSPGIKATWLEQSTFEIPVPAVPKPPSRPSLPAVTTVRAELKSKPVRAGFDLFADDFTINVRDRDAVIPSDTAYWSSDALRIGIDVYSRSALAFATARNMTVPVSVEVIPTAPTLNMDEWDHIVEAGIKIPSGKLVVFELSDIPEDAPSIEVPIGSYRLRMSMRNLNSLSEDGLEGDDSYHFKLWPARYAGVRVLKQGLTIA
jgi:hypothetical protein